MYTIQFITSSSLVPNSPPPPTSFISTPHRKQKLISSIKENQIIYSFLLRRCVTPNNKIVGCKKNQSNFPLHHGIISPHKRTPKELGQTHFYVAHVAHFLPSLSPAINYKSIFPLRIASGLQKQKGAWKTQEEWQTRSTRTTTTTGKPRCSCKMKSSSSQMKRLTGMPPKG